MAARLARNLLLVGAVAMIFIGASASRAAAAELIEGTWEFEGGAVLIKPTGSGAFKGTVTKATRFATCTHPVGQVMWAISGSGTHYTGTHIWYTPSCVEDPGGASTWDITSTDPSSFQLRFCTQTPGTGPVTPTSPCRTLTRLKPPLPPAKDVVKLPPSKRCVSRRKFKIRIRRPGGVKLRKVTIFRGKKRLTVLRRKVLGKKRHTATVDLRGLPRGTFKIKIRVVTVEGDVIKGSRKYKTCRKKRKSKRPPKL